MNQQTEKFWNDYCEKHEVEPGQAVDVFSFGESADELADLVKQGKKTATCSVYAEYEWEREPLPKKGDLRIVLDAQGDPAAVIRITEVAITPMKEVPEAFALAEGEGDYNTWWNAHETFFRQLLESHGSGFSENMLVVCERFEMVHSADES
ncbi:ASCH domain-containing protein [Salibacterium aidingense]|uniref:ASCH domain-containing protein n=1 Tax=Salibacterium aidingense TaxID=384933 RepID=UPI00041DF5CF|nr:ASCH domain-containing protein [Salibacterium aidingense]